MGGSWIAGYTVSCAAGVGIAAVRDSIATRVTGLRHRSWPEAEIDTWLGPVPTDLSTGWPETLTAWDSRNNRLAWLGLNQDGFHEQATTAIQSLGPARVGLIVGTSTSSIGRTEEAYAARRLKAALLQLSCNPRYTIRIPPARFSPTSSGSVVPQ